MVIQAPPQYFKHDPRYQALPPQVQHSFDQTNLMYLRKAHIPGMTDAEYEEAKQTWLETMGERRMAGVYEDMTQRGAFKHLMSPKGLLDHARKAEEDQVPAR